MKADQVEDTTISPEPEKEEEKSTEASISGQETDEELAAKIAKSKEMAWKGSTPSDSDKGRTPAPMEDPQVKEFANQVSEKSGKSATELSIEELEAELKRRREASST